VIDLGEYTSKPSVSKCLSVFVSAVNTAAILRPVNPESLSDLVNDLMFSGVYFDIEVITATCVLSSLGLVSLATVLFIPNSLLGAFLPLNLLFL